MSAITVTLTGDDRVLGWLERIDAGLRGSVLVTAVQAGALLFQNAAKGYAPKRTGTLARSIHLEVVEASATHVVVKVGTDLIYAAIQEYGGTITAKGGGWLVFQIDGHWVRVKSVTLPARPYMRPALDETRPRILAEIANTVRAQLRTA